MGSSSQQQEHDNITYVIIIPKSLSQYVYQIVDSGDVSHYINITYNHNTCTLCG